MHKKSYRSLFRWLEGHGQRPQLQPVSPFAYYLGRLCEEFPGIAPSELLAERARLPEGLLEEIVESRAFARAVAANTIDLKGWSSSPMRIAAKELELEAVRGE